MTTLRETLAEHPPQETSYDAGWIEGCWCGWERPPRISNEEGWAAYFAHLEAVVLAWVEARLAGAREGVARAVTAADDTAYANGQPAASMDETVTAALTALRDALGVPVAPAGGEVAPGATGGEIGPQNGAEGFGTVEDGFGSEWDRCGHDCDLQVVRPGKSQCNYQGEACPNRRDCAACPFLGCDSCEAEATRRANGGAE